MRPVHRRDGERSSRPAAVGVTVGEHRRHLVGVGGGPRSRKRLVFGRGVLWSGRGGSWSGQRVDHEPVPGVAHDHRTHGGRV